MEVSVHEMNHNSEAKNCVCLSKGGIRLDYLDTKCCIIAGPIAKELHVYALDT